MILGIKSSLLLTINHIINTIDDSYVWVCVSDKVKKCKCGSIWFNIEGKWNSAWIVCV